MNSADYEMLTVGEVAAELRMSDDFVYREIQNGRLTATRLGRYTRVLRGNLNRYLDAQSEPPVRPSQAEPPAAQHP